MEEKNKMEVVTHAANALLVGGPLARHSLIIRAMSAVKDTTTPRTKKFLAF